MSGGGVGEARQIGTQHADEGRRERLRMVEKHDIIDDAQYLRGIAADRRGDADGMAHLNHRTRCVDSLAAYVADRHHGRTIGCVESVVPIAAEFCQVVAGPVERMERQPRPAGKLFRKEHVL